MCVCTGVVEVGIIAAVCGFCSWIKKKCKRSK